MFTSWHEHGPHSHESATARGHEVDVQKTTTHGLAQTQALGSLLLVLACAGSGMRPSLETAMAHHSVDLVRIISALIASSEGTAPSCGLPRDAPSRTPCVEPLAPKSVHSTPPALWPMVHLPTPLPASLTHVHQRQRDVK